MRRVIGVPRVTAAQLRALVDRAGLPNVSVRVIPHRAGMYPTLEIGAFTILDFPTDTLFGGLPSTVHSQHLGEHLLLERTADATRYEEHWDDARAYALDEHGSLR